MYNISRKCWCKTHSSVVSHTEYDIYFMVTLNTNHHTKIRLQEPFDTKDYILWRHRKLSHKWSHWNSKTSTQYPGVDVEVIRNETTTLLHHYILSWPQNVGNPISEDLNCKNCLGIPPSQETAFCSRISSPRYCVLSRYFLMFKMRILL